MIKILVTNHNIEEHAKKLVKHHLDEHDKKHPKIHGVDLAHTLNYCDCGNTFWTASQYRYECFECKPLSKDKRMGF